MTAIRHDENGPLRVLRVTTTIESDMGGPSTTMLSAAVAEQRSGLTVTVVSTVGRGRVARRDVDALQARLRTEGVRARAFPRPGYSRDWGKRWGFSLRYLSWLILGIRRFDVVHIDYVWSLSTVAAIVGARLARRPVVLTPHESLTDFDLNTSRSWRRRLQKRLVRSVVLGPVATFVVASEIERHDSGLTHERARVVPHPVDDPTHVPRTRTVSGSTIGFLGRLHPKKRLSTLLEAIALAAPSTQLRVGGGHPSSELERLRSEVAQSAIAGQVVFEGFIEPADRGRFLAGIDVLVMPSAYECFGMVAAEAMAQGLPVIVTDRCGVADLVHEYHAGRVVPVDDPSALAVAVEALTGGGREARDASVGALRCVAERLTGAAYAAQMTSVYRGVIG